MSPAVSSWSDEQSLPHRQGTSTRRSQQADWRLWKEEAGDQRPPGLGPKPAPWQAEALVQQSGLLPLHEVLHVKVSDWRGSSTGTQESGSGASAGSGPTAKVLKKCLPAWQRSTSVSCPVLLVSCQTGSDATRHTNRVEDRAAGSGIQRWGKGSVGGTGPGGSRWPWPWGQHTSLEQGHFISEVQTSRPGGSRKVHKLWHRRNQGSG